MTFTQAQPEGNPTAVNSNEHQAARYFPNGTFGPLNTFRDTFANGSYSKQLRALNEPVVYTADSTVELYRFTWLRTFHNPVAIRVEKKSNQYIMTWKVCNGAGGYDPGELKTDRQIILNDSIWVEFQKRIEQIDFWNLETNIESIGYDGSEWILEGKKAGNYHVVERWTPREGSRFYECCEFLIKLTDLKIKKWEM
jgi:hypothetical protein